MHGSEIVWLDRQLGERIQQAQLEWNVEEPNVIQHQILNILRSEKWRNDLRSNSKPSVPSDSCWWFAAVATVSLSHRWYWADSPLRSSRRKTLVFLVHASYLTADSKSPVLLSNFRHVISWVSHDSLGARERQISANLQFASRVLMKRLDCIFQRRSP